MPRDTPKAFKAAGGAARITAAEKGDDGEPKTRRFAGVAYTGAVMQPSGWYGRIVCALDGFKYPSDKGTPALHLHEHSQVVGHTDKITASAAGLEVEGPFSGEDEHTAEVIGPADRDFPWQMSIGADPIRTEFLEAGKTAKVNGREVTGPLTISWETALKEVSFVPVGADGDTSAVVASGGSWTMNDRAMLKAMKAHGHFRAAKYDDTEIDKMTDDEAKAALKKCMAAGDDEDADKKKKDDEAKAKASDEEKDEDKKAEARAKSRLSAQRKAEADEERRCDDIRAMAKRHGVSTFTADGKAVNFVAHAIEQEWSKDKTELEAMRAARPGANVGGPTVYVTNKPEMNEAVLEAAVLHASRHQFKLEDSNFYTEAAPDGKTQLRRVPEYMEREVRNEMKARYTDQVQQAAHTMFRGRVSPHRIFELAFHANGLSGTFDFKSETGIRSMLEAWHQMERPGFRAEGASTISISNVLANVMNKFALQGYLFTEGAWRQIAAIRPVNDFKPTKSINLLGDVMYQKFGPMGELQHAELSDQAFANQAAPYGRIITIPWTYIVNDDLSMLSQVPMKIGQGAGLALNDAFWTLWAAMAAGTTNGDDGNAFWRTSSSVTTKDKKEGTAYKPNKTSGAGSALSNAALKTVKAMYDNQVDPNGNPLGFDGTKPTLLFPPTLWNDVMTVLQSPALVAIALASGTPTVQGGSNVWQNFCNPVMSRYIENANYGNTTTGWWMLFDPAALATVEVSFLNGVDTPAVLQAGPDYQFDRLGITIRGTMPFGVNAQNFRGGVYSVGA